MEKVPPPPHEEKALEDLAQTFMWGISYDTRFSLGIHNRRKSPE